MDGEGVGGRGRLYTYRYTVTTRMTPALRWAAMRDILMFHNYCEGQNHKTVSTDHNNIQRGISVLYVPYIVRHFGLLHLKSLIYKNIQRH